MQTYLMVLLLPSPARVDTLYLEPAQVPVQVLELGVTANQHAAKIVSRSYISCA